jgi:hypothetical protein
MTTATIPQIPQHMAALDRANEIRLARADAKRQLKRGELLADDLLVDMPYWAEGWKIGQFLAHVPHRGRHHFVAGVCRCVGCTESLKLGNLTERQMLELRRILRAFL